MKIYLNSGQMLELSNGTYEIFADQIREVRQNPNSGKFVDFWTTMVRICDISAFEK